MQFKQLRFNGLGWGSQKSKSKKSSYILAAWSGRDGEIDEVSVELKPAMVCYYFKHVINLDSPITHTFALVKWFSSHPARHHLVILLRSFAQIYLKYRGHLNYFLSTELIPIS